MKTQIKSQQELFLADLMDFLEKNDPNHHINPQWLVQEFVDHWCQQCANGKDILWEREKAKKLRKGIKASIGGALKTWRNNSKSWHPNKWNKNSIQIKRPTQSEYDYPEINYDRYRQNIDGQQILSSGEKMKAKLFGK